MPKIPFVGPSYQSRSLNFDAQRSVNCYLVSSESGDSKSDKGMQGTPGRTLFAALGPDGVRGAYSLNGRAFFVAGLYLYEVMMNGTFVNKGTLRTQYGPVAIESNGIQLMLVDGPNGYVLQLAKLSGLIVDGNFASANIVVNGQFNTDTAWSKGAGWTISAGQANAAGAISTPISQTLTGLTTSDAYIITYTATVTAGSITATLGNTVGTARTASGTYKETLISGAGTGISFTTAGFTGSIDNVTITPVDNNWVQGAGWNIANNVATATGAISTSLSQAATFTPGVSYSVTYQITQSAGSITPVLAGTRGVSRTATGTYTETIVAGTGTTFEFDTSGFTGTVISVAVTQPNDVFLNVTDPGFLGSDTIAFIDGYFILNKPASSEFYLSNLYDGTTYDALMFLQVEGFTDALIAVHAVHNQLWLLGKSAIQIYDDTGGSSVNAAGIAISSTFPFTPISAVFIEYGCAAAQTAKNAANTLFWVGSDKQGSGIVWMANGYQPTRISTFPVEQAIQSYGDISKATAYTYQEDGHYFYVLNFPSALTSWVYDVNEEQWHERAYYNLATGLYERDKPENHIYCFNQHLVGDYSTGNIYTQSLNIVNDNGNPIRRLRAAPHLADDLEYIFYSRLQIDMETGVGITSGGIQDTQPMIALQWSDDGGHIWSNEHWRPVGPNGAYRTRVIWRQLGRSRDRVFRIIYTGATKFFLIDAHADVEKGTN